MSLPADIEARKAAVDPALSCIVQAPAGSGKTGLLVRRYLALLARVQQPEEILAITFTRKATAEMRLRIINALVGLNENGEPEENAELRKLGNAALANDQRQGWQLVQNSRRLRVQTIDSFCNELVLRMPWSARFGAPPMVTEDASEYYAEAARRALDHIEQGDTTAARACATVLNLMDANLPRAVSLLSDKLANRDQWMRLLQHHNREVVTDYWRLIIKDVLVDCNHTLSKHQREQLIALTGYAARNLRALLQSGKTPNEPELLACPETIVLPAESSAECLNVWRAMAALLFTKSGTPRKTVNVNNGFPATDKKQKNTLIELIGEIIGQPGVLDCWRRVRSLPDPEISDHQWRVIEALFALLPIAAAELQLLFRDNNIADYTELAQRADLALGTADSPSDLALAFDYRLQHVLVDEFQDTSTGQIELLRKLLSGWQGDDGRTAFFVGDPMQSIYRFREAEVGIFLDVQQRGIEDVVPQPLLLECNFRSAPALVDWFNQLFPIAMPGENNVNYGAVRYSPAISHTTENSHSGAMVHAAIRRSHDQEAIEVVDLAEASLQRFPEDSIAILCRTRLGLWHIVKQLESRAIDYDGIKLQHLAERESIQDLISLTLALGHPADKIAWLSLLRAPWVGATLDDCVILMEGNSEIPVPALLKVIGQKTGLSSHFRARAGHLSEAMNQGFLDAVNIPLHRNLEACWLRLGGAAVCPPQDLENCQRYFQMIAGLQQNNIPVNRTTLEPALADLFAQAEQSAKIKILTIHAAKGLEFDTVILPGLHRAGRGNVRPLLRWKKLPDRLLLAPRPASDAANTSQYDFLGELDKEHQTNEASRLLYVACTRARKRLHLFASALDNPGKQGMLKPPPASSLLAPLWPAVSQEFVDVSELPASTEESVGSGLQGVDPTTTQLNRLPDNWLPPDPVPGLIGHRNLASETQSLELIKYEWARELARISGIVMHRQFQEIDRVGWNSWCDQGCTPNQKKRWRLWLLQNGLPPGNLDEAMALVEHAMLSTMQDADAAWIFSDQQRDIRTEWPVTGVLDGVVRRLVIDRSFVDQNDIRWIIDFKGSRHDDQRDLQQFIYSEIERYRESMHLYAQVVSKMEQRSIRTALYFPLLQKLALVE